MSWASGWSSHAYLWAFLLASLGYGMLVNVCAVLVGAWRFRFGLADRLQRGLLPFTRRRDVLVLLGYAVLENFGYRQLTLYWRLRGLLGRLAGQDRLGKVRARGLPRRHGAGAWLSPARRPRILVVDDDPTIARLVAAPHPARDGFGEAMHVTTGREALESLDGIDIVLLDHQLPDANGLDVLEVIRARPNPPAVVLITAHGNEVAGRRRAPARRGRLPAPRTQSLLELLP